MEFNPEHIDSSNETKAFSPDTIKEFVEQIKSSNYSEIEKLSEPEKEILRTSPEVQLVLGERIKDFLGFMPPDLVELKDLLSLNLHTQKTIQSIQPALQERMRYVLSWGDIELFQTLLSLNLHTEQTLQGALQGGMKKVLSNGEIDNFQTLLSLNLHTQETIQSIQPALQGGMKSKLSGGDVRGLQTLLSLNLHTQETIQSIQPALQERMRYVLSNGAIYNFQTLLSLNLHTFNPKEEPWFQPALQGGMKSKLSEGDVRGLQTLLSLNLHTEQTLQGALQGGIKSLLSYGYIEQFQTLLSLNLHTEQTLQGALQERMKKVLSNGEIDNFQTLLSLNLHTQETIQSIQPALQGGMKSKLSKGDVRGLQTLLSLNLHTAEMYKSLVDNFIEQHKDLITVLEDCIPGFTTKMHTSTALLLSAVELENQDLIMLEKIFQQSPHLTRAMRHEYGARLIVKYIKFDSLSKENIDVILTTESGYPDNSTAYRFDVQDKLLSYKRNREIVTSISEKGIPVDTWLSWGKEDHFTLGKEENKATTLLLENPIKRTQESFEIIANTIKKVLAEYKQDLMGKKVTEDTTDLQKLLEFQKEALIQAQIENNQEKIQGIQKGIVSTEARLASPKQVPAWVKALGGISSLVRLVEKIFQSQKDLKQSEEMEVKDAATRVARKQAIKKEEIKIEQLTQTLKVRYESLFETLLQTLSVLGKERAEGIIDDIRRELGEMFSHLETDFREFERIFMDDEKKTSLEGRSMCIRLASRAPRDLFIGNYTDCCVAIDNRYHGAESPISDYLTDLGMQIAIIEDEQAGIPVAAAWLFLGTNGEHEALVVDNIEGRGAYTSSYTVQLQDKLRTYIQEYATALNLPLSQGASHNELVITETVEDGIYIKLGGSNRADGIFLEAEWDEDDELE